MEQHLKANKRGLYYKAPIVRGENDQSSSSNFKLIRAGYSMLAIAAGYHYLEEAWLFPRCASKAMRASMYHLTTRYAAWVEALIGPAPKSHWMPV